MEMSNEGMERCIQCNGGEDEEAKEDGHGGLVGLGQVAALAREQY